MDQIIGQHAPLKIIANAINGGRLHHAWIFHGPMGVGKFTTAMGFARFLLCHQPQQDLTGSQTACGQCRSCRLIDNPQADHPDLHVINKELAAFHQDATIRNRKQSNIPVQVIRDAILGPAYMASQFGHQKVFIVDEAEMLVREGQNALLKTLEEPPDGTFFILVAHHEDMLLPTVHSRCQRVGFGLLDDTDMRRWLAQTLGNQQPPGHLTDEQQQWIFNFAAGSPGRAELAMNYQLDQWAEQINPMLDDLARGQTPIHFGQLMADLTDQFVEQWIKSHKQASKEAAKRNAVRHLLALLGNSCTRRMQQALARTPTGDPIAAEQHAWCWLFGIDLLQDAERHLAANVRQDLLLENLAVQWSEHCRY